MDKLILCSPSVTLDWTDALWKSVCYFCHFINRSLSRGILQQSRDVWNWLLFIKYPLHCHWNILLGYQSLLFLWETASHDCTFASPCAQSTTNVLVIHKTVISLKIGRRRLLGWCAGVYLPLNQACLGDRNVFDSVDLSAMSDCSLAGPNFPWWCFHHFSADYTTYGNIFIRRGCCLTAVLITHRCCWTGNECISPPLWLLSSGLKRVFNRK